MSDKIIVKPPKRRGRLDAPAQRVFRNKRKYTRKTKHRGNREDS